jgi:hypothetical protein
MPPAETFSPERDSQGLRTDLAVQPLELVSCRCLVFLVGPAHDDPERIVPSSDPDIPAVAGDIADPKIGPAGRTSPGIVRKTV